MIVKNIIETAFSLGLLLNIISFIPQIIRLIKYKDSHGISFLTFLGFSFIQLTMILHGIIVKDYLLTAGYLLSFIPCVSVTVMIYWFRRKEP